MDLKVLMTLVALQIAFATHMLANDCSHQKKIWILGASPTGKTSFLENILDRKPLYNMPATMGLNTATIEDHVYKYSFHDTSGLPRLRMIPVSQLPTVHAAIVMIRIYDSINKKDTGLQEAIEWISLIREEENKRYTRAKPLHPPHIPIILFANLSERWSQEKVAAVKNKIFEQAESEAIHFLQGDLFNEWMREPVLAILRDSFHAISEKTPSHEGEKRESYSDECNQSCNNGAASFEFQKKLNCCCKFWKCFFPPFFSPSVNQIELMPLYWNPEFSINGNYP